MREKTLRKITVKPTGIVAVSGCYALNVDDMCAWACYDFDFPVVRIRDGAVTGWRNDIKGASALAVAGSRVALFGGYGPIMTGSP